MLRWIGGLSNGEVVLPLALTRTGVTPNTSVRVDSDVLHQAQVAAVIEKKTLGQWLAEAILEKIEREQKEHE